MALANGRKRDEVPAKMEAGVRSMRHKVVEWFKDNISNKKNGPHKYCNLQTQDAQFS